MLPVIGEIRPWADPAQVQINRLPAHVPLSGFERRSLDGRWSLEMFEHPDRVPAAALRGERSACVTVEVPGNWTMQDLGGFVDLPHYTNVQMPFPGPPPQLPERNPTGVYRRSFTIGAGWSQRRTVLHVAGAESVHAVYVNGRFVGYGTDSRLPSEYDLDRVRGRRSQRVGDRGDALQRPELRRGSGPVVDGRPAPLGVAGVPPAGPHRRPAGDDRIRPVHRCGLGRCDSGRRLRPSARAGVGGAGDVARSRPADRSGG